MAKIKGQFNADRPQAEAAAQQTAGDFVKGVTAETRAAVKLLIVRSIREGIPVYDAARLLESMIGLNSKQVLAALAYRTSLIDAGMNITQAEKLTASYVKKQIRSRARTIARTEILSALNKGKLEAAEEAASQGFLDKKKATKTWVATLGACKLCVDVDGETVPLGDSFLTTLGALQAPPGHPNCRCSLIINP